MCIDFLESRIEFDIELCMLKEFEENLKQETSYRYLK